MTAPANLEFYVADANGFFEDHTGLLRLDKGIEITRGRLAEQGEAEPGTITCVLDNTLGTFKDMDTDDAVRLTYADDGSSNFVPAEDASFEGGTVGSWRDKGNTFDREYEVNGFPAWGRSVLTTMTAVTTYSQDGSYSLEVEAPSSTGVDPQAVCGVAGLVKGRTYNASIYVRVPAGQNAVTLSVAGTASSATTSSTGSFQRINFNFSLPSNYSPSADYDFSTLHGEVPFVVTWNSTTGGETVHLDGFMIREGSGTTTFTTTEPVHRFTGTLATVPVAWPGGNNESLVQLVAADRLATLARHPFRALALETMLEPFIGDGDNGPEPPWGPLFMYPLDDGGEVATAADVAGPAVYQYPDMYGNSYDDRLPWPEMAPVAIGKGGGADAVTFGTAGRAEDGTTAAGFAPAGESKPHFTILKTTWVGTDYTDELEEFRHESYVVCFRTTGDTNSSMLIARWREEFASDRDELRITSDGTLTFYSYLDGSVEYELNAGGLDANHYNDGSWHIVHITRRGWAADEVDGLCLYVDGELADVHTNTSGSTEYYFTPYVSEVELGGRPDGTWGLTGDIQYVGMWIGRILTAEQAAEHAYVYLTGAAGERTDERLARILRLAGLRSKGYVLEDGYGLMGAMPTGDHSVTDLVERIADTEGGHIQVDGNGRIQFLNRGHRWSSVNIISNPDFATNTTGWQAYGFGYGGGTITHETTTVYEAPGAMKITWPTYTTGSFIGTQNHLLDLVVGERYTASAWVYVPSGSNDVRVTQGYVSSGDWCSVKDDWVRITHSFVATTTTNSVGIEAFNTTTSDICYVDSVELLPGIELEGYDLGRETIVSRDNQRLVNRSTIESPLVASVTVEDKPSIRRRGVYSEGRERPFATAAQVRNAAEWRVYSRAAPMPRLDSVLVDLLTQDATMTGHLQFIDVGDVLHVGDLPATTSPTTRMSLIVDGLREHISTERWDVTLTTSATEAAFVLDVDELDSTMPIAY